MRVLYGLIIIFLILQQLSWAYPTWDEYSSSLAAHNQQDNSIDRYTTNNGNPTTQTDDKDIKHNPDNLRGLG